MYAIRNKRTCLWLYGTDYRYNPPHQRTDYRQALTYPDKESAELDFKHRKCGKDYEIVRVIIKEV